MRVETEDKIIGGGETKGKYHTMRLSLPTSRPSRISRASSEWPTSSKASVASWPPTSRRTSSPPLGKDKFQVSVQNVWLGRVQLSSRCR